MFEGRESVAEVVFIGCGTLADRLDYIILTKVFPAEGIDRGCTVGLACGDGGSTIGMATPRPKD